MAKSFSANINKKIEHLLNYPGCGNIELSSRKAMWLSTLYGLIHVFILTFSFLFFVPELTILIQYGFTCLFLLISALMITPFFKRFFKHYFTIHLLLLMLVTFVTIIRLGGIVTSVGLIVACFSFVLLSIPLQSVSITISLFVIYSIFLIAVGYAGTSLSVPSQITPLRNSIIWMINTLSMTALSLIFVVDFITQQNKFKKLEANKQKELYEAKTKLFTNITHEFRTPLTIIQGMTDLIEKQPEEWLDEGTWRIRNNSSILLRLINQMLDIARIETGSMHVHLKQSDIVSYLGYLTELFSSVAHEKNIRLVFLPEVSQVVMDFDPDKLVHIVSNLLSNALKFTPEGGSIDVKTSLNVKEDLFTIQITDTGKGIPPDHINHVFDRFYQVENSYGSVGGSGLGLALVKEIVELLSGNISVESQPAKGTTFYVNLPVTRNAEKIDNEKFRELFSEQVSAAIHSLKFQKSFPSTKNITPEDLPTLLIV